MKIQSFDMQVIDNRIHLLVDSEKQPEVKKLKTGHIFEYCNSTLTVSTSPIKSYGNTICIPVRAEELHNIFNKQGE